MASEFVWQSVDGTTAIHISLDVVDGIAEECMRGLAAVPKRGAEVGGVLLGSVARDGSTRRVNIDAFEAVPIEYRFGPSYLLSDADAQRFTGTMQRLNGAEGSYPVGFFRSNTRDEMELTADDVRVLENHLAGGDAVTLLIRPHSTKPSVAGFVVPVGGHFVEGSPPGGEFPFRPRELAEIIGVEPAPRGPRIPYRPIAIPELAGEPKATTTVASEQAAAAAPIHTKRRVHWRWVPLSTVFLVIGILLGIEATWSLQRIPANPYNLKLSLSRNANALTLSWDRSAPAIQAARRGTLVIEDGPVTIPRDLEAAELRTGSIVYTPVTNKIHFRLQVFPGDHDSLTETIDWNR